jgi:transcriptional regulator with XRE-family HTH domain
MKPGAKKTRKYFTGQLVEAREQMKLSQEKAAKLLNISQSKLSKIENGNLKVDVYLFNDIVDLYSKPHDYFFPKPLAVNKNTIQS